MTIKNTLRLSLFLLLNLCFLISNAQDEVKDIVRNGIALHDEGKFDEAILEYKKALKIAPNSGLVHYEIAYSFYGKKDYKSALFHVDKGLKDSNSTSRPNCYVLKGNVFDIMGQPKKAIKNYQKGIKDYPDQYLLHFNLGLTQYNLGEMNEAETSFINSLSINFAHPSSHYFLGKLNLEKGERVKGVMPLYIFLLIEPDTDRSKNALNWIENAANYGVKEKGENKTEIQLDIGMLESEFSGAELILSMSSATRKGFEEAGIGMTDEEFFAENTQRLFSVLKESSEGKDDFWWTSYVGFFTELVNAEKVRPYSYYISQSKGGAVLDWVDANTIEMDAFYEWINN